MHLRPLGVDAVSGRFDFDGALSLLEVGGDPGAVALGDLVQQGTAAVPTLVEALSSPTARVRAWAADGLGMIGDRGAGDALAKAVEDDDGTVRSTAAASLARLDDPRAVEALVRTLNDYTDEAHSGMSLSAYALIGLGTRIAPVVVPLLASDDQITRTRAVAILRKLASGDEALAPLGRILDGYDPTVTPEASAAPARSAAEWVERNLQ